MGTVFRLRPANGRWDLTVVHTFKDHPGAVPDAPLIFDANGNLYGTTAGNTSDGLETFGSIFETSP